MNRLRMRIGAVLALFGCLAVPAAAQLGGLSLPNIPRPNIPVPNIPIPNIPVPNTPTPHSPTPNLPSPGDLNPVVAARRALEKARTEALRSLHRLDPNEVNRRVQAALNQRLGNLASSGVRFDKKTGVADLRDTALGRELKRGLAAFVQGNGRSSGLDEFSYDVRARELKVRMYARHRQSWGTIPTLGRVDLYDITQRASFRYSFRTSQADYDIDLGPLAPRINSRSQQKLSGGDLLGAAEAMAPGIAGDVIRYERKNEYAARKAQYERRYGAANVYFASQGFVDWATPETVGRYIVNGVVTGGASVTKQVMHDARERARHEAPALTAWLKRNGVKQAERVATDLLAGRTLNLPRLRFELLPVRYSAREHPLNAVTTPWRHVDHLAFVIVFEGNVRPHMPIHQVRPRTALR